MNVYVSKNNFKLLEKSGVGRAIKHQICIHNQLEQKDLKIRVNKKSWDHSDVIHINSVFPNDVLLALNARLHGIKVIYHGHSTKEDFMNSFRGSNFFAPFFKIWIMFCYSLGDTIVTPTEYSRKILKSYGIKKPIVAISNGIDTEFWKRSETIHKSERNAFLKKYGISADRKVIMSVGHFMKRKGLPEFIAFARKNPDLSFLWFGQTDASLLPGEIKAALKKAPKNLIFAGHVSSEELRKAYQYCNLFLFLSHEETEGIVVLEAMACKTPMIVRNIPVYKGWLNNKENTYMFNHEKELDSLIPFVLSNDTSSITEIAYKTVSKRDFTHIGRKYLLLYKKMGLGDFTKKK